MKKTRLLTVRRAAELLGVHPRTVTNWCRAGQLRSITIANRPRIPEREIMRLIGENPDAGQSQKYLIVSRHPAAVQFIRETAPEFANAPAVASATEDDVRDAIVAGNLPLHLAALAAEVWAVEFTGEPPRGAEYSLEDMKAAGATLRRYRVVALPD